MYGENQSSALKNKCLIARISRSLSAFKDVPSECACKGLTMLFCSGRQLNRIPMGIPNKITAL